MDVLWLIVVALLIVAFFSAMIGISLGIFVALGMLSLSGLWFAVFGGIFTISIVLLVLLMIQRFYGESE